MPGERSVRVVVAALLVTVACGSPAGTSNLGGARIRFVSASGTAQLDVRIAATDAERERGLMGVTDLPQNEGMAFVWDQPVTASFWMKDTLIPLAIAFVDQDGRIVTIAEMTPCRADPCPTYPAAAPYVLAVEANAGWFDRHAIGQGDTASRIGWPS